MRRRRKKKTSLSLNGPFLIVHAQSIKSSVSFLLPNYNFRREKRRVSSQSCVSQCHNYYLSGGGTQQWQAFTLKGTNRRDVYWLLVSVGKKDLLWPLTPLRLTNVSTHSETLGHLEKGAHAFEPRKLSSGRPIRALKMADCDPSAPAMPALEWRKKTVYSFCRASGGKCCFRRWYMYEGSCIKGIKDAKRSRNDACWFLWLQPFLSWLCGSVLHWNYLWGPVRVSLQWVKTWL